MIQTKILEQLHKIYGVLINGMDGASTKIVTPGNSLAIDELKNAYAIHAPFGDVILSNAVINDTELTDTTLLAGNQIYGRIATLTLDATSESLVVYSRL